MIMQKSSYPPLAMHFMVQFSHPEFDSESGFQSIQGLRARIYDKEEGESTRVKFENIILKRAYSPDSKLIEWCMDAINNNKIKPLNLTIKLLNAEHLLINGWKIEKATPVAWGIEELNALESSILIETIEIAYHRFQVLDRNGKIIAPRPISKTPEIRKK